MGNRNNPRRGDQRHTEHGPRYETGECDAPSVAHARKSWKRIKNRTERRTGRVTRKYHEMKDGRPIVRPDSNEEG